MSTYAKELKDRYAPKWPEGNAREFYVHSLLELLGYIVVKDAQGVESSEYISTPSRDPGRHDYKLLAKPEETGTTVEVCHYDVTGTKVINDGNGWVVWSKTAWAKRHIERCKLTAYVALVEDRHAWDIHWIRTLEAAKWPIIERSPQGVPEHFHEVPLKEFMKTKQFLSDLHGRRKKEVAEDGSMC